MTDIKPFAVVTGASSGIGFELAKQFAQNGFDLLVTAEDEGLGSAADQLQSAGTQVHSVQADLSTYDGVERFDTDLADELRIIDLNVSSTVHLAKRLLPEMVARDDGRVLITSLMPGPTYTNFFHRADMDDTKIGQGSKDDPAQVAKQGFDALMAGKSKIIAGSVTTKAQGVASGVLPDKLKAAAHRQMAEPGSGE